MEGFSEEEIAKAVDHCDNDKIRGKCHPSIHGLHARRRLRGFDHRRRSDCCCLHAIGRC